MSNGTHHVASHASLLRDVSGVSPSPMNGRLDAIVVPASRPSLQRLIDLSATLSVPLVVLCSQEAKAERVAERVEATFGARALVIDVPHGYQLPGIRHSMSDETFLTAAAHRSSDLSLKRNLGLVLARLRGWNKILFIDDDIHPLRPHDVARFAGTLDRHPVAAMASREYPDNSVVCHARTLAGFNQDIFVGGAALGVNTQHPAVSFFPDVYNEDWFFFAEQAAERSLPKIGEAGQDEFDPFEDPERAAREEFGDLLAEGLYALFEETPSWDMDDRLKVASGLRHWELFIEDRHALISETFDQLSRTTLDVEPSSAQRSLLRAREQLSLLTPGLCVEFIQRWQADHRGWQHHMVRTRSGLSERDAMAELGLTTSISCGYGMRTTRARRRTRLSGFLRSSRRRDDSAGS